MKKGGSLTKIFKGFIGAEPNIPRQVREHEAGILLLKKSMMELFGIEVRDGDIAHGIYGKPYFTEDLQKKIKKRPSCNGLSPDTGKYKEFTDNGIFFNISHSGQYAICAISDKAVGCDIQKIRKVPRNLTPFLGEMRGKILDDSMERTSRNYLDGKNEMFIDTLCWTLYESFGKCLGCGVPVPKDDFDEIEKYHFEIADLPEGYGAAWCEKKGQTYDRT